MNLVQLTKRVFLFVLVNILMVATITVVLTVFHIDRYLPNGAWQSLAVLCLIWGLGASFISLAMSRLMAKWFMGVQVIPPEGAYLVCGRVVQTLRCKQRMKTLKVMHAIVVSGNIAGHATASKSHGDTRKQGSRRQQSFPMRLVDRFIHGLTNF